MKPKLRQAGRKGKQSTPKRQDVIRREHGRHLRIDGPPLTFRMPGLAGFYEWRDRDLLKFMAAVLAVHGSIPPDLTGSPAELALAECCVIARVVHQQPQTETFTIPLPGLAAHRALTADDILHYIAHMWHEHRAAWKRILSTALPLELAQMDIVCETISVRAGVLESMPYETHAHRAAFKHYAAALQTATHKNISREI